MSLLTVLVLALAVTASVASHVVTDLRIIEAATLQEALDACQTTPSDGFSGTDSTWVTAGVDWAATSENEDNHMVIQLCQQRTRVERLSSSSKALRRISVYTNAAHCPTAMQLLYTPRENVVVCLQYQSFTSTLSFSYITDVTVTIERDYNNDAPGWQTLPYNVHTHEDASSPSSSSSSSSLRGAFISFQRPVSRIIAIEVLNDVETAEDTSTACENTFENISSSSATTAWEQAGQGFLDQSNATTKTVLCVQRTYPQWNDTDLPTLVSVHVIASDSSCEDADAASGSNETRGVLERQSLSDSFVVCSRWLPVRNNSTIITYMVDLVLHRLHSTKSQETDDAAIILPGNFSLVSPRQSNLNTDSNDNSSLVRLFARRATTQTTFTPTPANSKPPLAARAVNQSLTFKILQIADMHYTGNSAQPCVNPPRDLTHSTCTEALMTTFINNLLDTEAPDFVVFTGDNVNVINSKLQEAAVTIATQSVRDRAIPFAMVFGNHDDENGFPREEILEMVQQKNQLSYTQRGPEEVDGVGNYELNVYAPASGAWGQKGDAVFRMYFLDSHGYPNATKFPLTESRYDWVKPSQIDYYRQLSLAHRQQNDSDYLDSSSSVLPAVMFFHIPLPEFASKATLRTYGEQNERVSSPDVNTNLFSSLVELQEVKAVFVGHDHVNEFCYNREGVQLCYGGGVGFGLAYGGEDFVRRARVIEWSVDGNTNARTIRSWKRYFGDIGERKSEEVLYTEQSTESAQKSLAATLMTPWLASCLSVLVVFMAAL